MLRRLGMAFCLGLILILIVPVANAQTCNTLLLAADIGDFADQMENTDPSAVEDVLDDMEVWIAQQRATCVPRSTDTGLQAIPEQESMYSSTCSRCRGTARQNLAAALSACARARRLAG